MGGVGDVLSVKLIAEIGDIRKYHSSKSLIAYAGINPPPYETAKANDLDPFKYLVYIFEKLSQDKDYDLEQLMPWTKAVVDTCKAAACE